MNKKIVVVGINHAGTSFVRTMLLENPKAQVVAFDRNDNISFLGCGIALAVGGVVKNTESLFYANPKALTEMGCSVNVLHDVTKVDFATKTVEVVDLKTKTTRKESFDKLVYAAGSWPFIMPFHKPEYKGIKLCKTYQQALELIEDAKKSSVKNVIVLGAGYIGIELTEAYAHAKDKKNVTLIDMQDRVIPRYFDHEFTDQLEASIRKEGVNLLMNHMVKEIVVDANNNVTALKAENTQTKEVVEVKADLVISCVGFAPNTKILTDALPDLKLSRNKAVAVNNKAQALKADGSVQEDLYVIGDCAACYFMPSKTHENIALATNAVKLGVVAASHMNSDIVPALKNVKMDSITGTNAICVFDYHYSSTGVSDAGAKLMGIDAASVYHIGNDRCEFMNQYGEVKIKLVYEKASLRLIGAQIGSAGLYNHTEVIYFLSLAIQKEMTLFDLATADVFFLPHFNKPFNFILCAVTKALGLNFGDHKYLA